MKPTKIHFTRNFNMNNKYNKAGAQESLIYTCITGWYPLTLMAE